MEILNQPETDKIGDRLKAILTGNQSQAFDTFHFLVAYVKNSGVIQLASAIQQFRQTGGRVGAVVGVSRVQKNTSVEGLQNLLPLCDEIWAYNNRSPNRTFHPKVYIFEKVGERGIVFVGSSNLTAGGLYTNYEANSYAEYDLRNPSQADKFASAKRMFQTYSTPSGFCKVLTPAYLQTLYDRGYLSSEASQVGQSSEEEESSETEGAARESLFGSENLHPPSVVRPPGLIPVPIVIPSQGVPSPGVPSPQLDPWLRKGPLLWRKVMTRRDLQLGSGNTNPPGGMALTQAGFVVGGRVIDQTTYFWRDIFGGFTWTRERAAVVTAVLFEVRILGQNSGQHRLTLRHNAKSESGQGNYTTLLSWGPLTPTIRNRTLLNRTLSLYGPRSGSQEPFYIEIS